MISRVLHLLLVVLASSSAFAANVTQVKGNRVLLDMTGLESAQAGDELFAEDAGGKKRALLKIIQVKGGRAIAEISKGKAQVGHEVRLRSVGTSLSREVRQGDMGETDASDPLSKYRQRLQKRYTGNAMGVVGEMVQTSMKASFLVNGAGGAQTTQAVDMKGSSFGVLGFYDYAISPTLQIRGLGGLQQLNAAGTIASPYCAQNTSTTCDFKVMYISAHGQGKFVFLNSNNWRAWVTGGYGFLIAMSKSSTVIAEGNISTNQMYSVGGGVDIPLSGGKFIPVGIEYGMFPRTATVEANLLMIRAGYAWNL